MEPEYDSIQHFGLGTAMNSDGATEGLYAGMMDEARVWNRALTQVEIQANMNSALTSGGGLIGRWGLEEGAGTAAADSAAPAQNGTLANGPAWVTVDLPALGDGTCTHTVVPGCCNTGADCNDGNACTNGTCTDHVCGHVYAPTPGCCAAAGDCNDGNICTDDSCDGSATCFNGANTAACNDGNACTAGDACEGGTCTGGAAVTCDDLNPCTDDACVNPSGCTYTNDDANACDDENACTTPDACSTGACAGVYAPTPGCCSTGANCDDGDGGTADLCRRHLQQ